MIKNSEKKHQTILKNKKSTWGLAKFEGFLILIILVFLIFIMADKMSKISIQAKKESCEEMLDVIASSCSLYYAEQVLQNKSPDFPSNKKVVASLLERKNWPHCPDRGDLSYDPETGTATCNLHHPKTGPGKK